MIEPSKDSQPLRKWPRRLVLAIGGFLVIASAVLVLGAFVPAIPYVGAFGSLALSLWPAWFIVLAVMGGVLAWWSGRAKTRPVLLVLAGLATLGAVVVTWRLVALARANGVEVAFGHPFGSAGGGGGSLVTIPPTEMAVYTHDLGELLNIRIYRPKRKAEGGSPVLMYVHGGGWIEGSSEQRSADMRWFADRGWLVVSIDYSLSSGTRHLWNRVTDQVGCAMAWTATNAASRGGDASRLVLFGESAGGNLVLNAAYMANAGRLRSSCGGRIPRVAAVSAVYPGVDLAAIHDNPYVPTGADVNAMARKYVGGSPQQYPGRYAAVASATYLSPDAPPTLMFMSQNDHLVPLASMQAFDAKARRAGVPIRTISVPYAEHGFDLTGIGNALVRQATLRFAEEHTRRSGHDASTPAIGSASLQ